MARKYGRWITPILIILGIAVFSGCSKLELSGSLPANQPPVVKFVNIPNDSSYYSYNPPIYWYGNDMDGYITEYYYRIILKDSLGNPSDFIDTVGNPDSTWTMVESEADTIFMYASVDPDVYWEQYIFLTAKDDDGAYAPIIFKLLARNNHEPDTYLLTEFNRTFYSYPVLTDYYNGIRVEWIGSDSLDFPTEQPEFEYHWTLYGPFSIAAGRPDSTFSDSSMLYYESYDSTADEVWVSSTSETFYDLRTGYYVFRVISRDDALVPDSSALDSTGAMQSVGIIKVFEPYWVSEHDSLKDIMVIDDSRYRLYPGELTDEPANRAFIMDVLYEAGIDTVNMVSWLENGDRSNFRGNGGPETDELMKHRMLLILNDDWYEPLLDGAVIWYQRYLNVGGKIMLSGRQCFLVGRSNQTSPFNVYYGSSAGRFDGDNVLGHFAQDYFNLSGSHFPGWYPLPGTNTNLNQEMIGATAYITEFPDVSLDTLKVISAVNNFYDTLEIYLGGVEYLQRDNESETIYKFASYQPEVSGFDNWPVAVRYAPEITVNYSTVTAFQTSYYSFPLYYGETEDIIELMQLMLEWYGIR